MRLWLMNMFFMMVAICAGIGMFMLKYRVIEKEEELFRIHRQIIADKREIHMLKGDWAMLNDPERLRALVQKQTNFKTVGPTQVVEIEALPEREEEAGHGI